MAHYFKYKTVADLEAVGEALAVREHEAARTELARDVGEEARVALDDRGQGLAHR